MVKEILLLGDERLYQPSAEVLPQELNSLRGLAEDLLDTLKEHRRRNPRWRTMSAPLLGVPKRMVALYLDGPVFLINPVIHFPEKEKMEVLDECLCIPGLQVKVERFQVCVLRYRNLDWQTREVLLQGGLSNLMQHSVDHLDGIMLQMRAIDNRAFFYRQPD